MEKPQSEREAIVIRTEKPTTLKNNLTLYKYTLRRDWNGKFWMTRERDSLNISFQSRSPMLKYEIEERSEGPEGTTYKIETPLAAGRRGPLLEMNDDEMVQYLLMENPPESFFLYDKLSAASKNYFADPANEDPSGLVLFLNRSGYKWQILPPHTIKIYT